MNRSTRILLRRTFLSTAIGMLVVFSWFLFLTFVDSPIDLTVQWAIPYAGFLVAYVVSYFGRMDQSLFPMTDKQRAWIPLVAWPAAMVAGSVGYFLGQLVDWQGLVSDRALVGNFWVMTFKIWPSAVFFGLICWRYLRVMPGMLGLIVFIPTSRLLGSQEELAASTEVLMDLWPLLTIGSVFLIWEAQYHMATIRKLDHVSAGAGFIQFSTPQLKGPLRSKWPTALADCLAIYISLGVLAWYLSDLLEILWGRRTHAKGSLSYTTFLLFLLFPIMVLTQWYRENRASGMSALRAFAVMLLECTGIGYVFRENLGVQRGAVVRCSYCRNWQMAWHVKCPHCGDTQSEKASPAVGRSSPFFTPHDPGALLFRVFIPLQLLVLILLQHIGTIASYLNR